MAAPVLQALTANRLRDGEVVYWQGGAWIETFGTAEVFAAKADADAALLRAGADVKARIVVNPYLFPVRLESGRPRAVEEREIVRGEGPSVRRDLGKQAHFVPEPPVPAPRKAERVVADGDIKGEFDVSL